jgi:hypothetical protein
MSRRSRRVTTRVTSAAAGLLLVAAATGACNEDDGSTATSGEGGATANATPTEPAVPTEVTYGEVTGRLPAKIRQRLSDQVGGVVDGWIDAAYVGGDYPRRDFSASWPGFTAGAQAQARQDRALMSNDDIGDRIDGVEPVLRRVRLDVLAVDQHPQAVTAHVDLRFTTSGARARKVLVRGRLFLTQGKQGWQVFGYDVTKGAAR